VVWDALSTTVQFVTPISPVAQAVEDNDLRRWRSAAILIPEVKAPAQALLDEGKSPAEVGKELSILSDTLRMSGEQWPS
jgi:hypothetical protein